MKHFKILKVKTVFAFTFLTIVISGCMDVYEDICISETTEIAFLDIDWVVCEDDTRTQKLSFINGDQISIFVRGGSMNTPYISQADHEKYYKNRTATYTNGRWVLDQKVPLSSANAKVYACYPKIAGETISFDIKNQVDYLVGEQTANVNSSSPTVTLKMVHVCSIIKLRIRRFAPVHLRDGFVSSIGIQSNSTSPRYIFDRSSWDFTTGKPIPEANSSKSIIWDNGGKGFFMVPNGNFHLDPVQFYIFPTPQPTTRQGDIKFRFIMDGVLMYCELRSNTEFKPGYIYSFDIDLYENSDPGGGGGIIW